MENRKDIGNAFRSKLNTLNRTPREQVWIGIQEELDQKKKRKGFIFWMLFASIAIGTITFFVYPYDSKPEGPSTNVVSAESHSADKNSSDPNTANSKNGNSVNPNSNNSESSSINLKNVNTTKNDGFSESRLINTDDSKSGENGLSNKINSGSNKTPKINSAKKTNTTSNSKNSKKANTGNDNLKNSSSENSKKSKYKKRTNLSEAKVSFYEKEDNAVKNAKKKKKSGKTNAFSESNQFNELDSLNKPNTPINSDANNLSSLNAEKGKSLTTLEERKLQLEDIKKASQKKRDSLIAAKKEDKKKKDLVEKPKEESPKDSIKTETAESGYEITVAPYFGYNLTGNLGNGNFINNSKTSKKTSQFATGYGVLVRIMGSPKIGMQTGVGIINSVYSATFIKESNNFINANDVSLTIPLSELNGMFPNQTKVTSRQETTFIEVPLEAYYILSDKKFGMATTFGISLLKFQKNEVFLESETIERIKIGTLENVLPFSSSINIKFNFFYKITSKLYFDLYPSFQYQLMSYKGLSNYHPYFFSIKTGLSYKL